VSEEAEDALTACSGQHQFGGREMVAWKVASFGECYRLVTGPCSGLRMSQRVPLARGRIHVVLYGL
jgi:hypothetical protein